MKSWLVSVLPFLLWTCCTSQNVCEEPPDIDFGEVISDEKARYLEGDRTQYKCNPGYVLEGTEWIICRGQKWTPAPRCLAPCGITKQQLDAKDLFLPGKRRRSQVVQHNHTLQFLCKEGHVITAPSVRKCINGHMDLPSCISEMGKNCSHTPTIENGDIITLSQKQYASGSSVEFKCQKYYAMEGENRTFCNNGNWTKVPICLDPCAISLAEMESKKVEVVGQSDEHHFQNFYVQRGTSVELACKPGHAPAANYPPSAFVIRCNGEAIVYPECKEITCNPPKVANGTFRPRRNIYHGEDLIQIRCDSGFHLADGRNVSECTRNGWSPLPQCSRTTKKCDYIRIENGQFSDSYESYPNYYFPRRVGQTADYRCQDGFLPRNKVTWDRIPCTKFGWSPEPKCFKKCDIPRLLAHGTFNAHTWQKFIEDEEISYSCEVGYDPTNQQAKAVCTKNGWSPTPSCNIRNAAGKCGPPPSIENGDFLGSATSEYMPGADVQYKCQALHNMEGNEYVRCVNGHWTDTPTCIAPCTATEEDMNQNNIRLKWKYDKKIYTTSGDLTEFACKSGFIADPSSPPFRAPCREGKFDFPRCIPRQQK